MTAYEYHMAQAAKHEKDGNQVRTKMHLDLADQCKLNSSSQLFTANFL
ncbi:hypothetical protein [Domibacillus tundrae]|nr:hypothetical protein [Domibacillus tundrae]